jgi:hypothetical protein
MCKKPILMLVLLVCSLSVFGQKWSFDGRFGIAASNLHLVAKTPGPTVDFGYPPATRYSYTGGLGVRRSFGPRFSVEAGVQYTEKGCIFSPDTKYSDTYQLHYLALPVWADYRIWKGISLQAGVETGRLLSAWDVSENSKTDIANLLKFNRTDVGLLWGIELNTPAGVFVNVRQVIGLSHVYSLDFTDNNGNPAYHYFHRNTSFQVSAGYRFGLKAKSAS